MTKIFIIGLEGATIEQLVGDERLTNFRCVAENGCYGPLAGVDSASIAAWTSFATQFTACGVDLRYFALGEPSATVPEPSDIDNYRLHLDHSLGTLLESLSNDSILLIVSLVADISQGAFILSAANLPISGELSGTTILDLPFTLLDLAGMEIPTTLQDGSFVPGKSLVAGRYLKEKDEEELSDEARRLIADRLSGLGYI